jgi:hypothetical protein
MSLAAWYRHKAAQCAQLAKDATDPAIGDHYKSEQRAWRRLAAQIESDERKATFNSATDGMD